MTTIDLSKVDLSKVPNLAARKTIAELHAAKKAAEAALDAAAGADDEGNDKYDRLKDEAHVAYEKRLEEIDAQRDADAGLTALRATLAAAETALEDYSGPAAQTDWNDDLEICSLSGLALLEGDDVLNNPDDDNEMVLRCLVLPARAPAAEQKAA